MNEVCTGSDLQQARARPHNRQVQARKAGKTGKGQYYCFDS
jgi:hypothetical protein